MKKHFLILTCVGLFARCMLAAEPPSATSESLAVELEGEKARLQEEVLGAELELRMLTEPMHVSPPRSPTETKAAELQAKHRRLVLQLLGLRYQTTIVQGEFEQLLQNRIEPPPALNPANTHVNGVMIQYLDEATNERICLIEHYAAVCCVGFLYEAAFFDIVDSDVVGETSNALENSAFFKGLLNRMHLRRIVRECVVILDVESEPESIQARTKYCRDLLGHVEHMVVQYVTASGRDLNAGEIESAFLKGDHNWKRFFLILLTSHFKQILHEEITDALGFEGPKDAVNVDMRDEEKVSFIIGLFRRELERRYGTAGAEQKSEDDQAIEDSIRKSKASLEATIRGLKETDSKE